MDPETSAGNTNTLLERYRAGDKLALQVLVERYYPRITRIVRVRMGPFLLEREMVEDVVQDVLVRILEGLEGYEPRSDARWIDWVARLAQNEIANHARRERTQKRNALARQVRSHAESAQDWDAPAATTGVEASASRREAAALVDRCLGELAEAHREVILWRDYAGADWKTVAEQMGRPSAEACQELHRRARRDLGRRLQGRL